MATATAFIRTNTKSEKAHVRFRLRDGRNIQLFYKSHIDVEPLKWDQKRQIIKSKVSYDATKRAQFNKDVADLKKVILDVYNANYSKGIMTSAILKTEVEKVLYPFKFESKTKSQSFFEAFEEFLQVRKLSEARVMQF